MCLTMCNVKLFSFSALQKFPDEGLTNVISNVFDFDKYSSNILETLIPVLHKHGIPINTSIKNISISKE